MTRTPPARCPREFPTIGNTRLHNFQTMEKIQALRRLHRTLAAFVLTLPVAIEAATIMTGEKEFSDTRTPQPASYRPASTNIASADRTSQTASTNSPAGPNAPELRIKTAEDAALLARELQFHPADAKARRLLGEFHFRRTEYDIAATNFSKSCALAPDDPLAANDLAASLVMLGKLDEARLMLENGLKNHPDSGAMRFNLACIAAKQNRKNDAISYLLDLEHLRWPLLQLHLADPDLDPLRRDSPFIAIQQRVQKLPAGVNTYESLPDSEAAP